MSVSRRRSTSIPAPPAALSKIIRVAGDPNGSLQELGIVCSKDAGLTVELLRLANSPRMGFADQVRNVPQAVVALGFRTVRAHAVTYAIRSAMASITVAGFDIGLFWEDSLRRAAAAQIIAEVIEYEDPFEAFALGLCQDLGSVLLALRLPHLSSAIQALRQKPGQARVEAERVLAGRTHAEEFARSQMAKMLPEDLTKAIEHHHAPVASGSSRVQALSQLATAADLVADVIQAWPKEVCVAAAEQCIGALGVKGSLSELLDKVSERMIELSHDLQVDIRPQPTLDEVVADAQLAVLQMSQEHEQEASRLEDLLRKQEEATRKLEAHNKKLLDMASKDPLTGLDNRRVFNRAMETEIDRVKRYSEPFSLIVVDVDHFKAVNDTYGHPAGDKVLKELAQRMLTALRDVDQVARLGGEEFGAILPSTSSTGARVAAERMRASVEAKPFYLDGVDLHVTISVGGVTVGKDTEVWDADDIFAEADKAMYQAKNKGRNQVRWGKI
jgi:diguanylate cyclase (GGDEF)-like protein